MKGLHINKVPKGVRYEGRKLETQGTLWSARPWHHNRVHRCGCDGPQMNTYAWEQGILSNTSYVSPKMTMEGLEGKTFGTYKEMKNEKTELGLTTTPGHGVEPPRTCTQTKLRQARLSAGAHLRSPPLSTSPTWHLNTASNPVTQLDMHHRHRRSHP